MKKEMLGAIIFIFILSVCGLAYAQSAKVFASKDPSVLFFAVGNDLALRGETDKAIDAFKQSIEYDPDNAYALHNLGVLYHELGDIQEAEKILLRSIESDENYAKAYYSLALIYYDNKEYAKAISMLDEVVSIEPANANAHFDLGVFHVKRFRQKEDLGSVSEEDLLDLREGLSHYLAVVRIDADFPHAKSNAIIVENVLNEYQAMS